MWEQYPQYTRDKKACGESCYFESLLFLWRVMLCERSTTGTHYRATKLARVQQLSERTFAPGTFRVWQLPTCQPYLHHAEPLAFPAFMCKLKLIQEPLYWINTYQMVYTETFRYTSLPSNLVIGLVKKPKKTQKTQKLRMR